jgi:hypothetical protein
MDYAGLITRIRPQRNYRSLSKAETTKIIDAVLTDEGHPPASVFDFVQGITKVARGRQHQDVRLEMEGKAKKLLDLVH